VALSQTPKQINKPLTIGKRVSRCCCDRTLFACIIIGLPGNGILRVRGTGTRLEGADGLVPDDVSVPVMHDSFFNNLIR
jgi:hypothetical protein